MAEKRLAEKLKQLNLRGLSDDAGAGATPTKSQADKQKLGRLFRFRIFFPMPPFHGAHFNALKAGHGCFNFTGLLLGVGGRQLQRIKQESHARVEVVNAHGNLNGTHPDPLDEDLHALITADSMAKLQKAVEMVVCVLSPTNASFEPFKVEPGGSTRLVVAQPVRKAAAADKPKLAKPLHPPSSSSNGSKQRRASLDGGSSTCSGRGMPPSPALTPVTPAASNGRHRSMFASSASSTNSCSSSRAPTPSPNGAAPNSSRAGTDGSHEHQQQGAGAASGSSNAGLGYMDALRLPPAALAAGAPALLQEEWPALPSSHSKQIDARSGSSDKAASLVKPYSSSSSQGHSGSKDCERLDVQQQSDRNSASSMVLLHRQGGSAAGSTAQVNSSSHGDSAQWAVTTAGGAEGAVLQSAGVSLDSDTTRTLSPFTPLAGQHHQHSRTGLFELMRHTHEQQQQNQGVREEGSLASSMGSSKQMAGMAGGQLAPVELLPPPAVSSTKSSVPPGFEQHQPQASNRQHCDLDLMMLRQRAGFVAQACLGGDSHVSCAGPTVAPSTALQQPYMVAGSGAAGLVGGLAPVVGSSAGFVGVGEALGGCGPTTAPYSLAGDVGAVYALQDAYQRQLQQQQQHDLLVQYRQQEHLAAVAAAASAAFESAGGGVAYGAGFIVPNNIW